MMQALVLDQPGSPATLRLAEVPRPVPGPGEVLVRVHAVGLNPVDYQLAQSGHAAWQYPFILGLDVSGTIEELGERVTQWRPGEPVYYHGDLSRPGGYAQWAVAAAHVVKPMLHEVIALDEIPTALVRSPAGTSEARLSPRCAIGLLRRWVPWTSRSLKLTSCRSSGRCRPGLLRASATTPRRWLRLTASADQRPDQQTAGPPDIDVRRACHR